MTGQPEPQQGEHNAHPVYRPDIDGLRAVAILSVVIFHAFPLVLKGGFIGVDIFFVISGFLISTIIFRSLQRGDFSFIEFYAHRIKRIFPALILVLTACFAFGWFTLLPDEFKQLGKHMAAGAGFAQNFALWKEVGYFDTAAELKPLLHLWSLAIEEQFYLVFPILIFAAWRSGLNVLTLVLLMGSISFGLNVSLIAKSPIETFFMPQTRIWELLAGSVLAYLQFFKRVKFSAWMQRWIFHPILFRLPPQPARREEVLNNILSVVGLFLLLASMFFINKNKPFPGLLALLPVFGAFLIILAGPEALGNRVVLANKLMVFVGAISYPLYLWHWPLLSFAQIIESKIPLPEIRIGILALSFVLSWMTYRLIEKPIRFGKKTWIKTFCLSVGMAMAGYIGYTVYQRDGVLSRVSEDFVKISKAAGEWDYPGKMLEGSIDDIKYYYQRSERRSVTLFVGDSNIEQYFPRVEALIVNDPKATNGVVFKTGGGCFPVPDMSYATEYKHCSTLMLDALKIAKEKPEIDTVVIGGQWRNYLLKGAGLRKKFGVGSPEYIDAMDKLGKYITEFRRLDKRVFLVLNIPIGDQLDPKYIAKRDLAAFPNIFSIRVYEVQKSELENDYGQFQADLDRVATNSGATVIKPIDFLCTQKCAVIDAIGEPIYKDAAHLRPSFVRRNANFIDVTVQ